MKRFLRVATYILATLALCFFILELYLRASLFLNILTISSLKRPELYAGYSDDDDYWKLYHLWSGAYKITDPRFIHPVLGWSQAAVDNKLNPLGLNEDVLKGISSDKKKILFYGDSYVKGSSSSEYWIANYINGRLLEYIVIDFGCGGYGLDQMLLLFEHTHREAKSPLIIVGVYMEDVDRSILRIRTAQKPYFVVINNALVLKGIPIDPDPEQYVRSNPVSIKSYLFRMIFRQIAIRNNNFYDVNRKMKEKKEINSMILKEFARVCSEKKYPLLFVLFYLDLKGPSWEEIFLKTELDKLGVPFLDTKEYLIRYARENNLEFESFYKAGDGHHNELGNRVIADALYDYLIQQYNIK